MNVERLRSGSYRIRMMIDGRRYSVTIDHKPTEKEAYNLIYSSIHNDSGVKGSFKYYANQYIAIKENVISPRTTREYVRTVNVLPEWFTRSDLGKLRASDVQRLINELSIGRSPKTVRNYHAFVSSIFKMYRPDFSLNTTLPQKIKRDDYIPTADDVRRIIECASGTEYSVFIKLACMGLRRSEICALQLTDLDENNVIHINKALVLDKNNEWVVKSTKTTASTRNVPISESLANEIREQGYIFRQTPNTVIKWLNKTQDKLGIPRFSLHKMRHFFASKLMDMGATSKDIMALGGWETDGVMKTVYQHSMKQDDEKRILISNLSETIF